MAHQVNPGQPAQPQPANPAGPGVPAATAPPATTDKDVGGVKRKARDVDHILYQHDMFVCITSRSESHITGHKSPFYVVLPELTSISNRIGTMAQASMGGFMLPRKPELRDVGLPDITVADALVDPVYAGIRASKEYRALHASLQQLDSGLVWYNNRFHFHPNQVDYSNMAPVTTICKYFHKFIWIVQVVHKIVQNSVHNLCAIN